MSLLPKELKFLKLLDNKKVDETDILEVTNFLKKLGLKEKEAYELAYLYTENSAYIGNWDKLKEPDRQTYEEYIESLPPSMRALMLHTGDHNPNNYEVTERSTHDDVTHTAEGKEYVVYDDYDNAESDAVSFIESYICDDPGESLKDYLKISDTDRRMIADEEADHLFDEMDEDEIIDRGNIEDEIEEINNQEEAAGEIGSKIDELQKKLLKTKSVITKKKIESKIAEFTNYLRETYGDLNFDQKREDLIDSTRERIKEEYADEVYEELDDPYQYFVKDHGLYNFSELVKQNFISFDCEEIAKDEVSQSGVSVSLATYDHDEIEIKMGDTTYYIYRTN
jgi:hypothetical protein